MFKDALHLGGMCHPKAPVYPRQLFIKRSSASAASYTRPLAAETSRVYFTDMAVQKEKSTLNDHREMFSGIQYLALASSPPKEMRRLSPFVCPTLSSVHYFHSNPSTDNISYIANYPSRVSRQPHPQTQHCRSVLDFSLIMTLNMRKNMVRKALVFCFQALTTKPDIVINYVKILFPL